MLRAMAGSEWSQRVEEGWNRNNFVAHRNIFAAVGVDDNCWGVPSVTPFRVGFRVLDYFPRVKLLLYLLGDICGVFFPVQ